MLPKNTSSISNEINFYLKKLFPINRSLTGNGNRKSLNILQEIVPLKIKEYSSGIKTYDWVIPDEWQVRNAWIKDSNGKKIVDFCLNNLHLVGYSEPIDKKMTFEELKSHLFYSDVSQEAIPYRTSYYKRNWGFCISKQQYDILEKNKGPFEVFIDSEFNPKGSMSIGEILIPGKLDEEILISSYICHPSLANDNLSGMILTAFLARELLQRDNRFSYRIIWAPETIGAIAYCSFNESQINKINRGLVITNVGGPGQFSYKQSHDINNSLNYIIESVFIDEGIDFITYPFDIHGSDERQFSSPGFQINTVSLFKDKYYEYPYYHSSLDNLDFVSSDYIEQSLELHLKTIIKLENEKRFSRRILCGEIMLSKHNLYSNIGGAHLQTSKLFSDSDLTLWILFWLGKYSSLRGLANHLKVEYSTLESIAEILVEKEILEYL